MRNVISEMKSGREPDRAAFELCSAHRYPLNPHEATLQAGPRPHLLIHNPWSEWGAARTGDSPSLTAASFLEPVLLRWSCDVSPSE